MKKTTEAVLSVSALAWAAGFLLVFSFAATHAHAATVYSQSDASHNLTTFGGYQPYDGVSVIATASAASSTNLDYDFYAQQSGSVFPQNGCGGIGGGIYFYDSATGGAWKKDLTPTEVSDLESGSFIELIGTATSSTAGAINAGDTIQFGYCAGVPGSNSGGTKGDASNNIYGVFSLGGGGGGGGGGATTTALTLEIPQQGTTTPSNTVPITISYTIGSDLANFSPTGALPSDTGIDIQVQNTLAGTGFLDLGTAWGLGTTTGTFTYSTSTDLASGDYTLQASLVGDYGTIEPAPGCTPIYPFITCTPTEQTGTFASDAATFAVATSSFPTLFGFSTTTTGLATTTCGVLNITGCFQNAIVFLFYPSPQALDYLGSSWQPLERKPPFGYFTAFVDAINSLNATGTPAFTLNGAGLFDDQIFTPIKTGLSAVLVISFLVGFYRLRLKHIEL